MRVTLYILNWPVVISNFIVYIIVIGMGRPFLIGCTNKAIIIVVIIIINIIIINLNQ